MWNKLDTWYYSLSYNRQFTLAMIGVVLAVSIFATSLAYFDNNGVRVKTGVVYNHYEVSKDIENPIKVTGFVKYRGDAIASQTRIIDFCEVKKSKKEMRETMKVIRNEMKEGCN